MNQARHSSFKAKPKCLKLGLRFVSISEKGDGRIGHQLLPFLVGQIDLKDLLGNKTNSFVNLTSQVLARTTQQKLELLFARNVILHSK